MFNALFALLMAAGVAIAWRSNPMYSLGRTVRFLALCVLAMAIFVGAIVGVIDATMSLPTIESGCALGVTILIGTMFLIWVIVTASTPHPAPLPHGKKLVFTNRRHVVPWFNRLIVALVVFAAIVLVVHGEARDTVLIIGGMFAFLAIIMVFTLFIAALGMDRSLTSVEREPWIHWTYAPDTWSAWRDVLVSRSTTQPRSWIWSRDWKTFLAPFLLVAVASLVLNAASVPLAWSAAFFVAIGLFMAAMIELTARFEARAPERLRRLLMNAPPETYAGPAGIFCDGAYVQWMTPANYLVSATIDERAPRCIDLEFHQIIAGAAEARTFTQSVLIPRDAGNDMRTLQAQLSALCPSATVELAPAV